MNTITPQEAAAGDRVVVDVREPDETAEVRIDGTLLLPMSTLMEHLDALPDGPMAILCRSGARSARVTAYLEQQGHDVVNIDGGILAWQDAGLPVVRG